MVKRTSNKKNKKPVEAIKEEVQHFDKSHILSRSSINSIAQGMCDCNINMVDYKIAPYCDEFMGLLGSHYALMIKVLKEDKKQEAIYVFVKTLPYEDSARAQYIIDEGIFRKELDFYKDICPVLYATYKGERWSPRNFPVSEHVLALEDLYVQGYKMHANWLNDMPLMKAALSTLARFHSSSILAEAHYAQIGSKFTSLNDAYQNILRETAINTKDSDNFNWISQGIQLACSLYNYFTDSLHTSEMSNIMSRIFTEIKPNSARRNVICHGDLWWNNMLFDSSGESCKCIFVDFQMIRYGPQVHDVLQLIYLHSTKSWREVFERELLEHYYTVLSETVSTSPLSSFAVIPNFDEFEFAYNDSRLYGLIMACLYLPFSLMDEKLLNECVKNRKIAEHFTWTNRLEMTKVHLAKNKEVEQLIKDVILETSDHCDLLFQYEFYCRLTVMDKVDEK